MSGPRVDSLRLLAVGCLTPLGDAAASHAALIEGRKALSLHPVLGSQGGDLVPMALLPGRALDEEVEPTWWSALDTLAKTIPGEGWGSLRRPVIFTSSNFGVGSLHAFRHGGGDTRHLEHSLPYLSVEVLRRRLGYGEELTLFSHACVTAHVGCVHAARLLEAGLADEVLVFSYDFLSPFVAGGFHALKILNGAFPAPYQMRESGSIGLGDGAAFAVFTRDRGDFQVEAQSLHNELHHFTANAPHGSGFAAVLEPLVKVAEGRKLWIKGHGTGTLEAGRLEASAMAAAFPGAPLVGWKGALGHTLGSCGLVELALAVKSIRSGRAPGTVGSEGPCFSEAVRTSPVDIGGMDAVLCCSNAFGGAHAALLLSHA